jgi:hypothetical protein
MQASAVPGTWRTRISTPVIVLQTCSAVRVFRSGFAGRSAALFERKGWEHFVWNPVFAFEDLQALCDSA